MDKHVEFLTTSIVYYNLIGLFHYYGFGEAWNISLFTYKVDYIKAIGGGQGSKIHVEFIWKNLSIAFHRFLQSVKIQILAWDIHDWVRLGMKKIFLFPIYFIYKNMSQNRQKWWFSGAKNGIRPVFMFFFRVSLWFVPCKTPKCLVFFRFWEIISQNRPFFCRK